MGSLGGEAVGKKKAMWLYPKVLGFNPSERWGHSACCLDGVVYVFGGCCGGLHFSDVLALDLETMAWSAIATTGEQPGTRDSHSAVLVGHQMIILGGTNGSKKVNDIHILDLRTKEWHQPQCTGTPPSPRESHTATVVGEKTLVIFGGSGEGGANYLNDLHILDLETMTWSSPEVKGDLPAPRDSHTAVAIGNRILVYGGDCGDRYHGEVDVFDMDTLTWSRLSVQGTSPGVRAGHAAVNVGSKVYILGGVGDKQYYSDVWVLDVSTCSWSQLDICGQKPQGRFSHTAVVTNTDIAIYGGCGEDERPLNELLILQLGCQHPNGRYNVSMCKIFGNHWSQFKHKFIRKPNDMQNKRDLNSRDEELETEHKLFAENSLPKKRRSGNSKTIEIESEQEEHSMSLSQSSSPSQSDHEQHNPKKESILPSQRAIPFKLPQQKQHPDQRTVQGKANNATEAGGAIQMNGESPRRLKTEQFLRVVHPGRQQEVQFLAVDPKLQSRPHGAPLIGAEVHGTVDGAFDSGYLMTANVNGQIFRGVLFAPFPGAVVPRPALHPWSAPTPTVTVARPMMSSTVHAIPVHARPLQLSPYASAEAGHLPHREKPMPLGIKSQSSRLSSDLQGVVLTLGGPGGSNC